MRETTAEVVYVDLDTLKPYDNNAKKHTNEQLDAIKASIDQFGFRIPILAWHNENNVAEIIAGHGRAIVAKQLGMEQVPVIFCDDLTDAQRRALTLIDNQTTMMTGWDDDLLAYELDVLADTFDMADFGFDVEEAMKAAEPPAENGFEYNEAYAIEVVCEDEEDQQRTYEALQKMGYKCKVVVV